MINVTTRLLLLLLSLLLSGSLFAQATVELPRKSPKAMVGLKVGLTDIRIDYSSPQVKGRTIWGNLVPYGEVWRAGANEATVIEFSTDVNVEGQILPRGRYGFFLIPEENGKWTIIFNEVANQWGAYQYEESKDVLRIEVQAATKTANEEHLTYEIVAPTMNSGYIRFAWEKRRLYIRFQVDVMQQAIANITEAINQAKEEERWQIYAVGADFLLGADGDAKRAMDWINASTKLFDHSWNNWIKARLQAVTGDVKGALKTAAKVQELGPNEVDGLYQSLQTEIEATIKEWERIKK